MNGIRRQQPCWLTQACIGSRSGNQGASKDSATGPGSELLELEALLDFYGLSG